MSDEDETCSDDGLACPYCQYLHREAYKYITDTTHKTECEGCGKAFLCYTQTTVTYCGVPLEGTP